MTKAATVAPAPPARRALRRLSRLVVGLLGVAFAMSAQAQTLWRQEWGWANVPPKFATKQSFDGAFNYCRGWYQSARWESGGTGWSTDYPGADINFSIRLSELTKTWVSVNAGGEPNHVVVRLSNDLLFRCPMVFMEDVGTAKFSDEEVDRLRTYLLKGGFLWVDDFWGPAAWEHWIAEIARVLPPADYPVVDVPLTHPIFRTLYPVTNLPQIPAIQFWRRNGGRTSERGRESAQSHSRGISDDRGRLIVFMTHNTDISDAWEREGEEREFFFRFSPEGYAIGIDVIMYAMTH